LLGAALVVYATAPWGPGVNETALHNFAAAERHRRSRAQAFGRGEPYVLWPPLTPALFALGRSLGLEYPTAGLVINIAAHAAMLFLSAMLLLRLFHSTPLAIAIQILLLASPELLRSATTLQTEPLFYALVAGALVAFALYLERPTRLRLAAVSALALLACLQRYAGVALVAGVGLLMLRHPAALARRTRWTRALVFGLATAGPVALWLIRNARLSPTQIDDPAQRGLISNTIAMLATLLRFITLDNDPTGASIPFDALSAVVAIVLVAFACTRWRPDRADGDGLSTSVYVSFPLAYAVVMVVSASRVNIDPIDNRYTMPMYPFVWGILLVGLADAWTRLDSARRGTAVAVRAVLVAWFTAHLWLALDRTHTFVALDREQGVGGFSSPQWQRSPVVLWLRAHPDESPVYSNVPEIVLFAAGRRAAFVDAQTISSALAHAPSGSLVVWLARLPRPVPFPELPAGAPHLERIAAVADGFVYRVEP
jgi:hypothetical protein